MVHLSRHRCFVLGARPILNASSDQAADAGSWLGLSDHLPMRPVRLPQRRPRRLLLVLSDHLDHDHPFHGNSVYRVRVNLQSHQPIQKVRSLHSLRGRWSGRSFCGRHHHASGRGQDPLTNPRHRHGLGDSRGQGIVACGVYHPSAKWLERFLARVGPTSGDDDA